MESAKGEPLAEWFTGELLPFGDLVSDVWLLLTLPRSKPDDYNCSRATFTVMRALLLAGTIADAIPEVAILLALVAGLMVSVCSKALALFFPAVCAVEGQPPPVSVRNVVKNVPGLARYMFSDGKAITNFLINRIGEKERTWDNTMELVAWHTLVTLYAPAFAVLNMCCRCVDDTPFNRYITMIVVQVIAGGLTEASSVFFAIMGGETVSIISAWFGLYSLVMTTMLAVYRGNLVRKFGPNAAVISPGVRDGCCRFLEGISDSVCNLMPAAVFGIGAFMVIFSVTLFATYGVASTEAWVLMLPGSLLICVGGIAGQLLIRHYHSTSHAGRIVRDEVGEAL